MCYFLFLRVLMHTMSSLGLDLQCSHHLLEALFPFMTPGVDGEVTLQKPMIEIRETISAWGGVSC